MRDNQILITESGVYAGQGVYEWAELVRKIRAAEPPFDDPAFREQFAQALVQPPPEPRIDWPTD